MTDEEMRLQAVQATGLLDTPAEGRFDRITRIARRLTNTSISTITLVDQDRQWFKSAIGFVGKCEDPREISLCSHAIAQEGIMVVEDTHRDARFQDNPLVTGPPFIRFYAGKPIKYDGQRVGTLCIIDKDPRELTGAMAQDLDDLALWVESEFDSDRLSEVQQELISEVDRLREMALVDPLTRTWNRSGIQEVFSREISLAEREKQPVGVIMADIDHFKSVNDTYGHDVGDVVLKRVADRIRLTVRPYDSIGRMGGEEFLVVLPKSHGPTVATVAERIRQAVERAPIEIPDSAPLQVTLSLGTSHAVCRPGYSPKLEALAKAADLALYEAKRNGRNQVAQARELKSV